MGRFAAAIDAGRMADPASPLWDTIGAMQADAEGRADERADYVRRALELDPGPEERLYLESLGAGE